MATLGDPRPPRDAVSAGDGTGGDPVPAAVTAWLDDVAEGARGPQTDAALAAVADRVATLRGDRPER
jgi:hypothetical protein